MSVQTWREKLAELEAQLHTEAMATVEAVLRYDVPAITDHAVATEAIQQQIIDHCSAVAQRPTLKAVTP